MAQVVNDSKVDEEVAEKKGHANCSLGFDQEFDVEQRMVGDRNLDQDFFDADGNLDPIVKRIRDTKSFKLNQVSLRCSALKDNLIFTKLCERITKHFILAEIVRIKGLSNRQIEDQKKTGVQFDYLTKMHKCLKQMLREVIITDQKQKQQLYLKRTYEWFIKQERAIGKIDATQDQKEADFLNPAQVLAKEEEEERLIEEKRVEFMDDDKHEEYMRNMFAYPKERTDIPQVLPAKDRIKQYKTRQIRGRIPSANNSQRASLKGSQLAAKSVTDLKIMPGTTKQRPMTAAFSQYGASDAPTADTNGAPGPLVGNFTATNLKAQQMSRYSKFEETEKAVKAHPFPNFYTSNEPVQFHKENRFEGKSNYLAYYPTGQAFEQEMEQYWFDVKNKELADKRRDEEQRETMKEWGNARGRMEAEIARKKEHVNVATNFEQARGWKRQNWKTKNFDPNYELDEDGFLQLSDDSEEQIVEDADSEASPEIVRDGRKPGTTKAADHDSASQNGPKVIDLTENEEYGFRPTTAVQAMQLEAIIEHNDKLPPKKKKKETLPEIVANNVYAKTIKEKHVDKKGVISYNYTKKYHNIGFIDGSQKQRNGHLIGGQIPRGNSAFTVNNRTKALQRMSSQAKIANLRNHFGGLIRATDSKQDLISNPFQHKSNAPKPPLQKRSSQTASSLSLSVYNRPASLSRPKTATVNIFKGVKGLEPIEVNEEGIPIEKPKDTRIADMQLPLERPTDQYQRPPQIMARTGQDQSRMENFVEIQQIKNKLSNSGCQIDIATLNRAVMMPEDCEWKPGERSYPTPGVGLMVNPFPKVKKKKKGKKGKKKK